MLSGDGDEALRRHRAAEKVALPLVAAPRPQEPLLVLGLNPFGDYLEPEVVADEVPMPRHTHGLLEELVGREIATRLRARYSELSARIDERHAAGVDRERWMTRAEPLNPDSWLTPEAVLEGVRRADGLFESLRAELLG